MTREAWDTMVKTTVPDIITQYNSGQLSCVKNCHIHAEPLNTFCIRCDILACKNCQCTTKHNSQIYDITSVPFTVDYVKTKLVGCVEDRKSVIDEADAEISKLNNIWNETKIQHFSRTTETADNLEKYGKLLLDLAKKLRESIVNSEDNMAKTFYTPPHTSLHMFTTAESTQTPNKMDLQPDNMIGALNLVDNVKKSEDPWPNIKLYGQGETTKLQKLKHHEVEKINKDLTAEFCNLQKGLDSLSLLVDKLVQELNQSYSVTAVQFLGTAIPLSEERRYRIISECTLPDTVKILNSNIKPSENSDIYPVYRCMIDGDTIRLEDCGVTVSKQTAIATEWDGEYITYEGLGDGCNIKITDTEETTDNVFIYKLPDVPVDILNNIVAYNDTVYWYSYSESEATESDPTVESYFRGIRPRESIRYISDSDVTVYAITDRCLYSWSSSGTLTDTVDISNISDIVGINATWRGEDVRLVTKDAIYVIPTSNKGRTFHYDRLYRVFGPDCGLQGYISGVVQGMVSGDCVVATNQNKLLACELSYLQSI